MHASPWLLRSGCGAWPALRLVFPHVFFQFNPFLMDKVWTLERLPILFGFPKNWLWTESFNIFAVDTNKHSCMKSCRLDCLSWWELFLQSHGVSAHKQTLLLWPMFTCFIRSEVGADLASPGNPMEDHKVLCDLVVVGWSKMSSTISASFALYGYPLCSRYCVWSFRAGTLE